MKPSDPNAPPVSAPDYGRSLRGLGFNLLVRDVPRAVKFATDVLGATAFYANDRFAAMKLNGGDFMFHHDATYKDNELFGIVQGAEARGIGVELRIYGSDPDRGRSQREGRRLDRAGRQYRQAPWASGMHDH